MEAQTNISEAVKEIQSASEEELKKIIEEHFERVRNQGIKIGAIYIAAAVDEAINKNLKKGYQSSLRDYQRAIKSVLDIVSVQLKQEETLQNDLDAEEIVDDGTAE